MSGIKIGDCRPILMDGTYVLNAVVYSDGSGVEITYRKPSNCLYGNGDPVPDRVWKDIYKIQGFTDGERCLEKVGTVEGTHSPQRLVPESVDFPEDGDS